MKFLEIVINRERNVRLTALLQDVGGEFQGIVRRPAVIVIPGGGYAYCSKREAEPIALEYARAGFQVFVLYYTVVTEGKQDIWPQPLEDYEEAYELIVNNSKEWHIDTMRIAVCGFSAGGHLSACAATIARNRPRAAILGYSAILPDVLERCAPKLPCPIQYIDGKTPPCFLFAARDDTMVDIKNTIVFADALCKKEINYEMHIYSYGNHGFSNGALWLNGTSLSDRVRNWMNDSIGFLEEIWGEFTTVGFTEPKIRRCINDDCEERLSVNCTTLFLENQMAVRPIIDKVLDDITMMLEKEGYGDQIEVYKASTTLRVFLEMLGMSKEEIELLNKKLKEIRNVRQSK